MLRFGTDGVRGVANVDLTADHALAIGRAAARVLGAGRWSIGRDTRRSGPMLEAALAAGLASEGAEVELLGVVPTPAVAHRCRTSGGRGAVVSASHNPFADNGIKLLGPGGRKLADDVQDAIEAALADRGPRPVPTGAEVGTVSPAPGAHHAYVASLVGALEGRSLHGLSVVLDVAHGAAFETAPEAFRAAGAAVTVLHDQPDGCNINDRCGSTHPDELARVVPAAGADLGLALDGDADRVIAVAHDGTLVDGDQIIVASALDLAARGRLRGGSVAVTVMANLGLRRALASAGVGVVETPVGDRYVLDALEAGGLSLGGEQSGHVIFHDIAPTGDGTLTGLLLADLVARAGRPLAALAGAMTRYPQVLVNVRLAAAGADLSVLAAAVAEAEAALGAEGRVLVRASGTEPLVRVMVEAATEPQARAVAEGLAGEARRRLDPA